MSDYFRFFVKFIKIWKIYYKFIFMLDFKNPKLKFFCVEFESEKFVNDTLQFLMVIELELELEY